MGGSDCLQRLDTRTMFYSSKTKSIEEFHIIDFYPNCPIIFCSFFREWFHTFKKLEGINRIRESRGGNRRHFTEKEGSRGARGAGRCSSGARGSTSPADACARPRTSCGSALQAVRSVNHMIIFFACPCLENSGFPGKSSKIYESN